MSFQFAGAIAIVSAVMGVAGFFFCKAGVCQIWSSSRVGLFKHFSIAMFVGGMVLLFLLGAV